MATITDLVNSIDNYVAAVESDLSVMDQEIASIKDLPEPFIASVNQPNTVGGFSGGHAISTTWAVVKGSTELSAQQNNWISGDPIHIYDIETDTVYSRNNGVWGVNTTLTKADIPSERFSSNIVAGANRLFFKPFVRSPVEINKVIVPVFWVQLSDGITSVFDHSAAVINNEMYVYGGRNSSFDRINTLQKYDPSTDTWTRLSNGPVIIGRHEAATINDKMYVYGGFVGNRFVNTLYEYSPATDSWSQLTRGPDNVAFHSIVSIGDKLYLYGGKIQFENDQTDTLFEYDSVTDTWTQLANGPVAVRQHSAVAINGKMYVYGGENNSNNTLNTLFEYDPATDTWTQLADGPFGVTTHAAVSINGKMVVYSGWDGSIKTNTLYEYDPATNSWTQLPDGPFGVNLHSMVAINDKMYIYGGRDDSFTIINTLYVAG